MNRTENKINKKVVSSLKKYEKRLGLEILDTSNYQLGIGILEEVDLKLKKIKVRFQEKESIYFGEEIFSLTPVIEELVSIDTLLKHLTPKKENAFERKVTLFLKNALIDNEILKGFYFNITEDELRKSVGVILYGKSYEKDQSMSIEDLFEIESFSVLLQNNFDQTFEVITLDLFKENFLRVKNIYCKDCIRSYAQNTQCNVPSYGLIHNKEHEETKIELYKKYNTLIKGIGFENPKAKYVKAFKVLDKERKGVILFLQNNLDHVHFSDNFDCDFGTVYGKPYTLNRNNECIFFKPFSLGDEEFELDEKPIQNNSSFLKRIFNLIFN